MALITKQENSKAKNLIELQKAIENLLINVSCSPLLIEALETTSMVIEKEHVFNNENDWSVL